jgi:DNA-binding NtrC family response regulator
MGIFHVMSPHVYILDDDPVFAELVKANLGRAGEFRIQLFQDPLECLEAMAEQPPDALLTDLYMPEMDGVEVARRVRRQSPHLPLFVLTAHGEIDTAIEALKAGANEYLLKPVNVTELTTLLRRALKERPLLEEATSHRREQKRTYSVDAILGEHPLVEEVREFIRGVAKVPNVSVLLLGESGVGKNLAAHAVHYADDGATGRFVEVNCAALPEHLLEAELFGYMKGAFTDARESKPGLVEVADGGTLFLDEIGEMEAGLQAKLLNFLESRRFRRLGGTRELEVSLRLVTATNRNLEELLASGDFREDLFYRVSVARHTLPSLREIKSDIPVLADHIVQEFAGEFGKDIEGVDDGALDVLTKADWPGNVRELRNVLERAMIFASGPRLTAGDLPSLNPAMALSDRRGFSIPRGLTLTEVEKEYIRLTMAAHDGTIQEAAESLGISRKNLWEKRKKHGLDD